MNVRLEMMCVLALLALSACQKENTVGNGPGDADGWGGRTDPPAAASDPSSAAQASSESASPNTPSQARDEATSKSTREPPPDR
jgi:hypothetical protein